MSRIVLLVLVILIGLCGNVKAQCTEPEMINCFCVGTQINCRNKMLKSVPTNIPKTTTYLDLSLNDITVLPEGAFDGLKDLESLILSSNNIAALPDGIFDELVTLQVLELSNNDVSVLSKGAFGGLTNLKRLEFNFNNIAALPDGIFEDLVSLEFLGMVANNIAALPDGIFDDLASLMYLYLSRNNLTDIAVELFTVLSNLITLTIDDNPTKCCDLLDLIDFGKTLTTFTLKCYDFEVATSYQDFNASYCPIDGQWSEWTSTICSVTCGDGVITRTRECNNPVPKNGGKDCVGVATEEIQCSLEKCAIDGQWSEWTTSECSVTCGDGIITRTRECNNPVPANGGDDCVGVATEEKLCSLEKCAIDGQWSEWTTSECSVTCGDGISTRTKECNNPAPANGGEDCVGIAKEEMPCSLQECRGNPCVQSNGICQPKKTRCQTLNKNCGSFHQKCCKKDCVRSRDYPYHIERMAVKAINFFDRGN